MKELCDPADDDGFMPFKRKPLMTSQRCLILHLNSWISLPKKKKFNVKIFCVGKLCDSFCGLFLLYFLMTLFQYFCTSFSICHLWVRPNAIESVLHDFCKIVLKYIVQGCSSGKWRQKKLAGFQVLALFLLTSLSWSLWPRES